ncbi:MAG: hypothetical protein AAGG81_07530 [Chlamydiota bacterium]
MGGFVGADRSYHWEGGIPPISERQINVDFEAGALQNKAYADVVKEGETLDANILKGMPYGRNQSEANKPTLEFPMMNIRAKTGGEEKENQTTKELLENLKNLLPKELRENLSREMSHPEAERNPIYAALEKSLAYTAAALALLNQAAKTFEGESSVLRFAGKNLQFTEQALQDLMRQGKELLREGYISLKQLGPNHPHFDTLLKHLKNAANALKLLKRISDEEKEHQKQNQEEEDEKEEEVKQDKIKEKDPLELAIERIELYSKHYRESFAGDQLLMIGPLYQSMSYLSRTQLLNDGLRSMLFSLLFYHIGIGETPSKTSPIGKGTSKVITQLMNMVNSMCLSDVDARAKEFFPYISQAFVTLSVAGSLYLITTHAHHEILGESMVENEEDYLNKNEERLINTYTLWNLIKMFLRTNIIGKLIPSDFFEPKYGITNSLDIVTKTIELTVICIAIRAIKQIDEDSTYLLLSGLAESLIIRTKIIEHLVDQMDRETVKLLHWNEDQKKSFAVNMTNCRMALQNEQFEEWSEYWDQASIALGMEHEEIELEIERLCQHATMINSLFIKDLEDFSNAVTGIVQI